MKMLNVLTVYVFASSVMLLTVPTVSGSNCGGENGRRGEQNKTTMSSYTMYTYNMPGFFFQYTRHKNRNNKNK